MKQTKLVSLIEATLNMSSGFLLSLFVWQVIVAPLFGYEVTFADNLALTSIFTVISIARSYAWRRFFNAELHRRMVRLLGGKHDDTANFRRPGYGEALRGTDLFWEGVLLRDDGSREDTGSAGGGDETVWLTVIDEAWSCPAGAVQQHYRGHTEADRQLVLDFGTEGAPHKGEV